MKTRGFLKYFVDDCRLEEPEQLATIIQTSIQTSEKPLGIF